MRRLTARAIAGPATQDGSDRHPLSRDHGLRERAERARGARRDGRVWGPTSGTRRLREALPVPTTLDPPIRGIRERSMAACLLGGPMSVA
jgi:hypothetical protein